MKKLTLTALVLALTTATSAATADTILIDDFTANPQSVTHRIGGGASQTPTAPGAFVFSPEATVLSGTQLPPVQRTLAVRQSGNIWNNNSSLSAIPTLKYYGTNDVGGITMGVDALYMGHYGDLHMSHSFTALTTTSTTTVDILVYGVCVKSNVLSVTATNGATVKLTIAPNYVGQLQTHKIPVSAFNQPGYPKLVTLSSLKYDVRAIESNRFGILRVSVSGVNYPTNFCPSTLIH